MFWPIFDAGRFWVRKLTKTCCQETQVSQHPCLFFATKMLTMDFCTFGMFFHIFILFSTPKYSGGNPSSVLCSFYQTQLNLYNLHVSCYLGYDGSVRSAPAYQSVDSRFKSHLHLIFLTKRNISRFLAGVLFVINSEILGTWLAVGILQRCH